MCIYICIYVYPAWQKNSVWGARAGTIYKYINTYICICVICLSITICVYIYTYAYMYIYIYIYEFSRQKRRCCFMTLTRYVRGQGRRRPHTRALKSWSWIGCRGLQQKGLRWTVGCWKYSDNTYFSSEGQDWQWLGKSGQGNDAKRRRASPRIAQKESAD